MSDAEGWNRRYAEGTARWDLGEAPPVLTRFIAGLEGAPRRVLVPGAGLGHDAIAWARGGHVATAVDFAPLAVEGARALARERGVELEVVQADIFDLPASLAGSFDLVWEQTCLCAIDPERRSDYADSMYRALRPEGELVALLWNHGREGGPPWNMDPEAITGLLAPRFERRSIAPVDASVADRTPEYLTRFVRRG